MNHVSSDIAVPVTTRSFPSSGAAPQVEMRKSAISGRRRFLVPRVMWRNGWRIGHLLIACGLVGAAVLVTIDAWDDILRIAIKDEESSQLWLVPIAVAWLAWIRRGRLRYCRPREFWIGPAVAALGAAIYFAGKIFLIESLWQGGAVLLAVGCLITAVGGEMLRNFFVVFVTLLFFIPVPGRLRQRIAIPLESATAMVTQHVCELLGIDVEQSGNLLRVPDNRPGSDAQASSDDPNDLTDNPQLDPGYVDVTVGEACNGMRLTFALLLVSFVFAFATPLRTYVRVLMLFFSPVSAVLCNVIRLIPTIWVYGHYARSTADRFHDASGWVMLVVAFLLVLGIIRLLRWTMLPVMALNLAYD
jgi:exosortase/archaeosortase family protein